MANAFDNQYTAAVLGAAGGIGQPLSLLLASNKNIGKLHLYDVVPVVMGVAKDISHINTDTTVLGFAGSITDKTKSDAALANALKGVDICVIPAGVPRKPGMTRDDLFAVNAKIVKDLVEAIAIHCPKSIICIISNPVNSTVPIAAEVLKAKNVFNPRNLFGVSTLDIIRANKFISEITGLNLKDYAINVPVIGGHSGETILPLLSQISFKNSKYSVKPTFKFSQTEIEQLTLRIQNAGTEVVDAKQGGGSATLSMAYAGAAFVGSVIRGLNGETDVIECTFVFDQTTNKFFASPVLLGRNGVEKIYTVSGLSEYEEKLLKEKVIPELEKNIKKGVEFVTSSKL